MPDLHHLYCSSNLLCCNGLFVELTNPREFLRGTRRTLNLRRSHSLYRSGPPACQWFIAGLVAPGSPCRGKSSLNSLAYCLPRSWAATTFLGRSFFWKNGTQLFSRGAAYNIARRAKTGGTTTLYVVRRNSSHKRTERLETPHQLLTNYSSWTNDTRSLQS